MTYETIVLKKAEHVATVTLNRPKVGNAFDMTLNAEFDHAIRLLGEDRDVRAIIITGAGSYFSNGIDLSMFTTPERHADKVVALKDVLPAEDDETFGKGTAVAAVIRIKNMPKPVIAAVNGTAVGLGLSIVLACDITIASATAKFGMVFVKLGVVPDTGASFDLPRVVGLKKACELTFTGDIIDASEAERIGMVSRVVSPDELMDAARQLAQKIANNPPLAVGLAKSQLYRAMVETDMIKHMKWEVENMENLMKTADFLEAASAFFEKRKPIFKGE
jgi:2-(1,2-epoxy-1,2-dihydrophenyl)acetyl-CoA isomerase